MLSLRWSLLRLGGKTYGGCLPGALQMPPGCLLDRLIIYLQCIWIFWRPGCLPHAFQMLSMILLPVICPPQWSLLYDCSCNDSSFMLLRYRLLFHNSWSWSTENSVWGLVLGSCWSWWDAYPLMRQVAMITTMLTIMLTHSATHNRHSSSMLAELPIACYL